MQVTQQIYVAEEWVKNARDKVTAEVQSRLEAEKVVGSLKQEKAGLSEKLKEAIQARDSAEASLKTTERQAEDMCQKLHITEINLATEKQTVLDLKVELQKAKEAAQVAREAIEAAVKASYEGGVQDTEARLLEEVAVVCKDNCTKSWGVAMDRAGVPADSKLRRAKSIHFLKDIWEILESDPPPKQLLSTQAPFPDAEVFEGVGVGKDAQPPMKDKPSEDSLTIRDMVS